MRKKAAAPGTEEEEEEEEEREIYYSSVDSLRLMDVEPSMSTMCCSSARALLSRLPPLLFRSRDEGTDEEVVSESAELQYLAVLAYPEEQPGWWSSSASP